ncbi:sugar ABC transporter permease [Halanaerobium sp.]|uniref:ABC transporter permease n=1 Tax=Halanaerobium sp. TaxID=1895664 RepID=UPI000DE6C0A7|nr:ABC transporter permease subunit [Halanaerobium sp.]PUU94972.1 MAG: multiple sugar transport system permease protein [Halanaerobium sp.]
MNSSGDTFWQKLWKQKALVLMSLPFIIYVIIFKYIPLWGWLMAFQNYWPGNSFFEQTWVGLENFRLLLSDPVFFDVLRNTLAMSIIKLLSGMFFSILLALVLNEVRFAKFKKITQTISYLPHFISWVVGANLVMNALSTNGIVNDLLLNLGIVDSPIMFMGIPKLFWWIVGASHVWKTVGFGAILYLASIVSISPSLYEAAVIDGASRLQRIRYITLPALKPVIIILLIINVGRLMNMGFQQIYLLSNGRVIEYSRIFRIFELDFGLKMMRYSFATAAGIFRSLVSIVLVFSANQIAKMMGEERLL